MTMTIKLPKKETTRLHARSEAKGMEEDTDLHDLIADRSQPKSLLTGAEVLVYWNQAGCLGTFNDRGLDSITLASKLRTEAENRNGIAK